MEFFREFTEIRKLITKFNSKSAGFGQNYCDFTGLCKVMIFSVNLLLPTFITTFCPLLQVSKLISSYLSGWNSTCALNVMPRFQFELRFVSSQHQSFCYIFQVVIMFYLSLVMLSARVYKSSKRNVSTTVIMCWPSWTASNNSKRKRWNNSRTSCRLRRWRPHLPPPLVRWVQHCTSLSIQPYPY